MSAETHSKTQLAQIFVWEDRVENGADGHFTTFDSEKSCSFCTRCVRNLHQSGEDLYCAVCFTDKHCTMQMVNGELRFVYNTERIYAERRGDAVIDTNCQQIETNIDSFLACL